MSVLRVRTQFTPEIPSMEKDSARQQKRQSAKKQSDHSVYSQKAIRVREAQLEKKKSCSGQGAVKRV